MSGLFLCRGGWAALRRGLLLLTAWAALWLNPLAPLDPTASAALAAGAGDARSTSQPASQPANPLDRRFDYRLRPQRIAPDTYVLLGHDEYFNPRNGGNIVNTAFIVTAAGVVVIDTGPSLRYGRQMRQAIARITRQPVVRVFITHAHPDHFLGNQAFPAARLYALPATAGTIRDSGQALAENLYRLAGDWMLGTEPVTPPGVVTAADEASNRERQWRLGGHVLRLLPLTGHTAGDLAIFDESTGVLFAGDLVFNNRAPTTPNADIPRWLDSLDRLAGLAPQVVVPGHGAVRRDTAAINQTRDYLQWLVAAMRTAAAQGLDMTEVLQQPLPERFAPLAVGVEEYGRSVTHLYPGAEQAVLRHGAGEDGHGH